MSPIEAAFEALRGALAERDPAAKCARVASADLPAEEFAAPALDPAALAGVPGRPEKPMLIRPQEVPHRGLGTPEGRVALIHAVAHIEFNAINLALDAAFRFRGLPASYYRDWLSVAKDEARHFTMLCTRLRELGCEYGDFAAHNGLWEAAEKTAHDPLARMALVPRVLEARGLDVTPGMIRRLEDVGDGATAGVLRVILEEEVRHVTIGTRWFRWLCTERGVEPVKTFRELLRAHAVRLRAPLNLDARAMAGFETAELVE